MSIFRSARPMPEPVDEDRSLMLPAPFVATTFAAVGDVTHGETSLGSVALASTADLIASLVSELPVEVYRSTRRVEGATPGNLDDPGADGQGREDWLYRLMMSWLLRGNGYGAGLEVSTRTGTPMAYDLLHPDDVRPVNVPGSGSVEWYVKGKKMDAGMRADFAHWRVNPSPGRVLGSSPVERHAATIGVSLSSTKFGQQWFTEGAHPSGILASEKPINDADGKKSAAVKVKFRESTQGSRDPLVLGGGWTWHPISVTPNESQFLATIGATEAQCARMFGPGFAEIMGYESGGSLTYANVVDRRQDLLVFSMGKWLRRADRVLTKLLPPSALTVRLNRDALLETTTLQRYQAHASALQNQWRTPNEVRQIEDLQPVPWGDAPMTNKPRGVPSGGQPA